MSRFIRRRRARTAVGGGAWSELLHGAPPLLGGAVRSRGRPVLFDVVSVRLAILRQHVPAQLTPDLGRRGRRVVRPRARVHVVADQLLARWDGAGHGRLAKVAPE